MDEYPSIFDASLKVNIPNYITELLMAQYFAVKRTDIPRTAFWRKKYKEQCSEFEFWSEKYRLELSEVINLLKVFPARVLAETIKSERSWTLKYLNKEQRQAFVYKLYNNTLKHQVSTAKNEKKQKELNLRLYSETPKETTTKSFSTVTNIPTDL